MPRSNASFLGQLLGTSRKIGASALDDSVAASLSGGGGVTTYETVANLPLSGNTVGDHAFVSETSRLYIFTGPGWYNIALINTNPNITSGADASYALNTDGTPTIVTLVANDPEGLPITWSYAVTTGSLANGGGNTATVTQVGNEFTITPSTNQAHVGNFDITFTASDGVNLATSASTFTLQWYTPPTAVEYLVIAGGGGGSGVVAGGGGAGGYRSSVVGELSGAGQPAEPLMGITEGTTYSVTVGSGGIGGIGYDNGSLEKATSGANSVFGSIVAIGGGFGGGGYTSAPQSGGNGGSGGGGGTPGPTQSGGSPTFGQGGFGGGGSGQNTGGGGGGAGGDGTPGGINAAGNGGSGRSSSITGSAIIRAGGGGGGGRNNTGENFAAGTGGVGGGGAGQQNSILATAGTANTGGGGGAGGYSAPTTAMIGASGGSGVVILRYADSYSAAASTTGSPTITVAGGYRVYEFTQSGSITF